jgi:hypothetical protein
VIAFVLKVFSLDVSCALSSQTCFVSILDWRVFPYICIYSCLTGDVPSLEEWVSEMDAFKYPFRPPPVDKYVDGSWERVKRNF